jgi:NAD(P)H-dependent FMN reductase
MLLPLFEYHKVSMQIYIISASQGSDSQSLRVANYMSQRLSVLDTDTTASVLDLATAQIPLVNDDFLEENEDKWSANWSSVKAKIQSSDGFIFVTPEWGGMVTPAMLNWLLATEYSDIGHKPALLTGVSGARGGAYPISQLRSMGYKNNRVLYLPEHLIIRDVEDTMTELEKAKFDGNEPYMAKRIDYSIQLLLLYAKSQSQLRQSDLITQNPFENGM